MISRRLAVLLVLLTTAAYAQIHGANSGRLHVRVVFSDGHPCNLHAHVVLFSGASSTPLGDAYTGDEGTADFGDLATGGYHLLVSGEGIENADSGQVEVDAQGAAQSLFVTVKRTAEAPQRQSTSLTVSALELNIPDAAKKDFDNARTLMAKQDWNKAKDELVRAVTIYPHYASAYNNLGVVYARLGDRAHERDSLQTAIRLDEHFAAALVNLATMAVVDHKLPEAEPLLNRAAAADPNNVQTLMLLAKVQFAQQHWEAAIATCHKIHFVHLGEEPFGHYIAAHALERENRNSEAAAELHTFLEEEPTGARADAVRKEVDAVESSIH
ncbi:MAG: tetratricopeptide repeat protein [Terriglobales bacterium]